MKMTDSTGSQTSHGATTQPYSSNCHPRRAFLRRMSGGAAALGMPVWLAACGGGGDSGPAGQGSDATGSGGLAGGTGGSGGTSGGGGNGGAGGGNTGGTGFNDAVRAAAIAGVEDHCRTLA